MAMFKVQLEPTREPTVAELAAEVRHLKIMVKKLNDIVRELSIKDSTDKVQKFSTKSRVFMFPTSDMAQSAYEAIEEATGFGVVYLSDILSLMGYDELDDDAYKYGWSAWDFSNHTSVTASADGKGILMVGMTPRKLVKD